MDEQGMLRGTRNETGASQPLLSEGVVLRQSWRTFQRLRQLQHGNQRCLLHSKMSKFSTRGGRKPKVDPSVNRYVVRFNAEENARFLAMFEKSDADNKAAFIKHFLFQKPFKVFYVDENTRIFIDRLAGFNSLYRTIGVTYDNLVATLNQNFTEKKAMEAIAEIKKLMIKLISVSQDIADLAKEFDESWSLKSR